MDYNNSSRRFRPWGLRVMAFKCDSLALRTESSEEWIFSSRINCMLVWEWLEWERKCSETVLGLDLMFVLSTACLCSLNLSLNSFYAALRAVNISRTNALQTKPKDSNDVVPFVVTYNTALPRISNIPRKHFNTLHSSNRCKDVFKQPPFVAYRRSLNLRDILVKAQLRLRQIKI